MSLISKILIANRGEIALRIIRSANKLGIKTVAIYVESESHSSYVTLADQQVSLGKGSLTTTFLNIEKIIDIAKSTGVQAIHPGYGFLSEDPAFAKACEENGILFIGPSSEVLNLMSSKPEAKKFVSTLGIPMAKSYALNLANPPTKETQLDFPILIKAAFGGGGKGMELVYSLDDLHQKMEKSSRVALSYFGNGTIFAEQYIQNARHVEVQIIGDNHNNIIHLYERECSIQRNHQKIVEEAPALFLSEGLRSKILTAALTIGKALKYTGAGTVEFLVDDSGNFFFMEMNPRIQVEHAISEQITGLDIVHEQLRIVSGLPLSVSQKEIKANGHAIEVRVYAENPSTNFTPSTFPVLSATIPNHKDIRIESDLNISNSNGIQFDPLLIKLISTAKDRTAAIKLLQLQLKDLSIIGPTTNASYLDKILNHPAYQQNKISIDFCKIEHSTLIADYSPSKAVSELLPVLAGAVYFKYLKNNRVNSQNPWNQLNSWRLTDSSIQLVVNGEKHCLILHLKEKLNPSITINDIKHTFKFSENSENNINLIFANQNSRISAIFVLENDLQICYQHIQYQCSFPGSLNSFPESNYNTENELLNESGEINSPLHGRVLEINISENQLIKKGDLIMVIEAMKSENRILSPKDGRVRKIAVNVGAQVTDRMPLVFLEDF
jgi:acetyl/propionyl-CoA carboxylase alpha subunit